MVMVNHLRVGLLLEGRRGGWGGLGHRPRIHQHWTFASLAVSASGLELDFTRLVLFVSGQLHSLAALRAGGPI